MSWKKMARSFLASMLCFSLALMGCTRPTAEEQTEQYRFDKAGRLCLRIAPDGGKIEYRYNQDGLPVEIRYPGGWVKYGYDADGRRIWMQDETGITEYYYDAWHRPIGVAWKHGAGKLLIYDYDGRDNLSYVGLCDLTQISRQVKYADLMKDLGKKPDQVSNWGEKEKAYGRLVENLKAESPDAQKGWLEHEIGYHYDLHRRLTAVDTPQGQIAYDYDPEKGQVRRSLPNGITSAFIYAPDGSLKSLRHEGPARQPLVQYTYDYNPAGKVIAVREVTPQETRTTGYVWDTRGYLREVRLPDGGKVRYDYDVMGNRTLKEDAAGVTRYAYDQLGRLTQAGSERFRWDINGNLTAQTGASHQSRITYDGRNLPVTAKTTAGTYSYRWDGDGNQVFRQDKAASHYYLPNPLGPPGNTLAEYDKSGKPTAFYIYGDALLAKQDPQQGVRFFLEDGSNSVRMATDRNAKPTGKQDYSAFGLPSDQQGDLMTLNFRKTGERYLPEIKSYIVNGNLYSPDSGRFFTANSSFVDGNGADSFNKYADNTKIINNYLEISNNENKVKAAVNLTENTKSGFWNALARGAFLGTRYGEESAEFWARKQLETGNWLYAVPGVFASLWTPETWLDTAITILPCFKAIGGAINKPFERIDKLLGSKLPNLMGNNFNYTHDLPSNISFEIKMKANKSLRVALGNLHFGLGERAYGGAPHLAGKITKTIHPHFYMSKIYLHSAITNKGKDILLKDIVQTFYLTARAGQLYNSQTQGDHINLGKGAAPPEKDAGDRSIKSDLTNPVPETREGKSFLKDRYKIEDRSAPPPPSRLVAAGVGKSKPIIETKAVPPPPGSGGGGASLGSFDYRKPLRGPDPPDKNGGAAATAFRDPFKHVETKLGGIKLAAAGKLVGEVGAIKGAVFDPDRQCLVLLGDQDLAAPQLRPEDLAIALLCVYGPHPQDPTFSLDPDDPKNPDGPWLKAVYRPYDLTAGTEFGNALFQADWLLKQYSFGVNVDQDGRQTPRHSAVPGFKNSVALVIEEHFSGAEKHDRARLWIESDDIRLKRSSSGIYFDQAKMRVKAKRQVKDPKSPTGLADVETSRDFRAVKFADQFTRLYDQIAEESPEFERVRQLAKAVALAKWMKEQGVKVDMAWVAEYANKRVPMVKKAPRLSVSYEERQETPITQGNRRGVRTSIRTVSISGGVNLKVEPKFTPDDGPAKALEQGVHKVLHQKDPPPVFAVQHNGQNLKGWVLPVTKGGRDLWQDYRAGKTNSFAYEFDKQQNLIKSDDKQGNVATFEYNDQNRLKRVMETRTDGSRVAGEKTEQGSSWSIESPRGHKLQYDYDLAGLLKKVRVDGKKTADFDIDEAKKEWTVNLKDCRERYVHDNRNQLKEIEFEPINDPTTASRLFFDYNRAGKLSRIAGTGLAPIQIAYGPDGLKPARISTAAGNTDYLYYPDGRLKEIAELSGATTRFDYDGQELSHLQVNYKGVLAEYWFTKDGLARSRDLLGGVTEYGYAQGRLESVKQGQDREVKYTYDAGDRLKDIILPDGSRTEYRYSEGEVQNGKEKEAGMTLTVVSHPAPTSGGTFR